MKVKYIILFLLITNLCCKSEENTNTESIKKIFTEEQIEIGTPIWNYLRSNPFQLNSLSQTDFTHKIDSLKKIQTAQLNKYKGKLDKHTFNDESIGIHYAFDKFILEYPGKHQNFTGKKIVLSEKNQLRLKENINSFNDISLLSNRDLKAYIHSYISIESDKKLKSGVYNKSDNQQLVADWHTIQTTFNNQEAIDFWKHNYLRYHIDNLGIKNIDTFYKDFIESSKDSVNKTTIQTIYESIKKERASHSIETYKYCDGFNLEMHLFLPDTSLFKGNRPTIVYFHGGSWSEGKPDWFFETAKEYTKKGWVAAAVEYRIKGRHGTYPFEAVKDAKSAIRWLREHSTKYNINPNGIIATGNSAGGHLSIATALVDNWNEQTDTMSISPVPNVVIANAGVYDLTTNNNRWIRAYAENKELVKEISPNHLAKKTTTKFLLIHGEKDRNCPYANAQHFFEKMQNLGTSIELHSIKNAEHFIWYGQHSQEVEQITKNYINKLNFE